MVTKIDNETIDPLTYFDYVKSKTEEMSDYKLNDILQNINYLADKAYKTGQTEQLIKMKTFFIECIEREYKLLEMGITKYVYSDDITMYINHIGNKEVKIIELNRYPREIPDELVDTITKTKGIFDNYYVLFTDYTGKVERQVKRELREKDPILFGAFIRTNSTELYERLYYLGDWADEYCDLTLDKFITNFKQHTNQNPVQEIKVNLTLDELRDKLNGYKVDAFLDARSDIRTAINESQSIRDKVNKRSFFDKIRTVIKW
jgi:hypothetical protein